MELKTDQASEIALGLYVGSRKLKFQQVVSDIVSFHEKFNQDISQIVDFRDKDSRDFRLGILQSEVEELVEAVNDKNAVQTLQELCDVLYTVLGVAIAFGFAEALPGAFQIIHQTNMDRSTELTDNGKNQFAIKGEDYIDPRPLLEVYLKTNGWAKLSEFDNSENSDDKTV